MASLLYKSTNSDCFRSEMIQLSRGSMTSYIFYLIRYAYRFFTCQKTEPKTDSKHRCARLIAYRCTRLIGMDSRARCNIFGVPRSPVPMTSVHLSCTDTCIWSRGCPFMTGTTTTIFDFPHFSFNNNYYDCGCLYMF